MGSRGNNGGGAVPEASRKMVRSLKEVVGCPEAEIYAMLKECNMDPNEAVNRLLSQDPFHEVKSKREKKKENKYTTEPKSRGTNSHSSRGGRGGSDNYVGRGGTPYSSSETGALHGKPAYKKENGSSVYASHSSVSSGTTGNVYRQPPAQSDSVLITDTADGGWPSSVPTSGFSQPSSGNQPVWGGVPGQKSMADIVKMGRPQPKASNTANQSQSYHDGNSFGVSHSKASPDDEWPLVEPSTRVSHVQPVSGWHTDSSHLSSNIIDQHPEPEQDEVPAVEDEFVENIHTNHDGYASVSSGRIHNDNPEGASHFNDEVYDNMESYQRHENAVEYREVEDVGVSVSSVTSNLQQLNVVDDLDAQPEEDDAAVIIPNHLQVQTEDCLHLSFGSFGSLGAGPASSVPFSSRPTNSNIEEARADVDAPSVAHLDARNSDYYGDESLRTSTDGNLAHRTGASGATSYDSPSISQSEVLNQENREGPHENQYTFQSSNYSFENAAQLNASFPPSQTSAQMQTFADQAYGNALPSSFLAANSQSTRESDFSYSPFAMGQSLPAKYGNTVPSVSSSTVSMPEVLKAAGFSSTLQTPQNLPGSNIATGPALPQHLMHQYSQMGQYANLIGYPFMPQSYYLPGAYQQAFAGNNAYHQSLGQVLPQYKNSVSVSSLPQSAAVASGYGGSFGSSTSLPGNFPTNQPSAPGAAAVGYEDVLSSQYKDASHLLSLQQAQNENQAMWVQGHGSRTMSGIPANTYYSYQGQNQQQQQQQSPAGFRQNQQQPSQNYGAALGNSNFYHSQSGILLDHQQQQQQQQNPRDVSSQAQANKQSQQLWQNSY